MDKYTSVSTYKRGKKWQARLRYKENGVWKELSKILPEAQGKKEANKQAEELRKHLNKVASKEQSGNEEKTVYDVVRGYIEHQHNIGLLEDSTYSMQIRVLEKHIKPYLGDYIFDTLDRTAIIDWHTQLSNKGYSQHYIYYIYTVITKVYNYYVESGEITKNPFHTVKGLNKSKTNRVTHLTQKQMEEFLMDVYLQFDVYTPMLYGCLIAFYGGLRRGEICGLRWRDLDFTSNTLTVSSAVGNRKGGTYTKGPKNESSKRTFPMMPQLSKMLKDYYDYLEPDNNWFVIGDQEKYMSVQTFSHKFSKFVRAYNLRDAYGKYVTPHGLRHNLATVGMRSNIDIAALSLMMGHADRAMTLNIYGDANEQSKKLAVDKLSKTFSVDTSDSDYYADEDSAKSEDNEKDAN